MLKCIALGSLMMGLSTLSSVSLAQIQKPLQPSLIPAPNNNPSVPSASPIQRNPIKVETLPTKKTPGQSPLFSPTSAPSADKTCSAIVTIRGKQVTVTPDDLPGAYCDQNGVFQYKP
jgi:hypothetical protein